MYVTVVRPYGENIRKQVFGVLAKAGLTIREQDVIPAGTDDTTAIDGVLQRGNHVLLVPFHGHRCESGESVDGMTFLRRLYQRVGADAFHYRILLPASRFAAAAVSLALELPTQGGGVPSELKDRILVLHESELGEASLPTRIREHAWSRTW